ncbi:MAG TPA: FecR family protein [Chthoniobacteraceae bacterium]|nr:FecR family protein [Chthoniobacteraceae bacterium]
MKRSQKLLVTLAATLGLALAAPMAHADTTLTSAQITQIIKEVKTIDPGKGPRDAVIKETLQGEQALRTGVESRAELLFNDHTITRLGANTHFSFKEGTRNMSLDSGVMLLQVPKGAGGAKIETAAVTAAVTGTTIMVEAGKNYTKLIVLEGECCLWPKNDKDKNAVFKFKHKTCAEAGQEIILRNGAKEIPDPVYVNLKVLEGTSLLITGDWNAPLNPTNINTAANNQGPGNYVPTNLAIIGAGTDVTVIQGQEPPPGGNPPPGGTPPGTPPGKYGPLGLIPNSSNYTIGGGSTLNTDPKIINSGNTAYGRIYRGAILDGPPVPYLFGAGTSVSFPDLHVDNQFPAYGVAAFKFSSLNMQNAPMIQKSGNSANNIAFVSEGSITMDNANPTTFDFQQLEELSLFTNGGDITVGANVTITNLDKFHLYSYGSGNNIEIDGTVNLSDSYYATTQGDYTQNGDISANNAGVFAGNSITVNGSITTNDEIDLETQGSFGGEGFLSAPFVNLSSGGQMTLNEFITEGPNFDTVNGVQLDMNALETLNITGKGISLPNGFTGESFSDGQDENPPTVDLTLTSLDDGDTGSGTIEFGGSTSVDSLTATADSDITVDSEAFIGTNYDLNLTSNNGNIFVYGELDAGGALNLNAWNNITIDASASLIGNYGTQITSYDGDVDIEGSVNDNDSVTVNAAGNITTGSASTVTVNDNDEGDNTLSFTSTGGSTTVTLDGDLSGGTITVTGANVHTKATLEVDGLYGSNEIDIYSPGNIMLDGYIQTPTLNVNADPTAYDILSNVIPTNTNAATAIVTIPSTSTIYADNVTINASIVDLETLITSDEEDFTNEVTINTSNGITPLVNNDGDTSLQDFYSLSGNGAIDAGTIQITSRGDIILDENDSGPTVNNVAVDFYGNLNELDLSGATIEVPSSYSAGTILNLTANNGDITIGSLGTAANINLGTGNSSEFSAIATGNIYLGGDTTITADTVTLQANQVTTDIVDPTIVSGNVTVTTNGADVHLTQDSDTASTFYLDEFSLGEGNPVVGDLTLDTSSTTDPVISISGNALQVGNIDASSFDSFSITLNSLNDINAASSGTITAATSVALQVGVAATLAGDGESNIAYNGGQLTIDTTYLNNFSVTAASVDVEEGFPTLENASVTLAATGTGGITLNSAVDAPNGSVTLNAPYGDVTLSAPLTAGGDVMVTGSRIDQYEGGPITSSGSVMLIATAGHVNLNDSVSGSNGITISAATYIGEGSGTSEGSNVALTTGSGGALILTANNGDIDIYGPLSIGGAFSGTAAGSINFGTADPDIGGDMNLTAGNAIDFENNLTINGNLTLTAGSYIHTQVSSTIFGATSVTLTLTDSPAVITVVSGDAPTLYFGVPTALEQEGYGPIAIDLTNVIEDSSTINATATSLTFDGGFDEDAVSLNLTASNGTLTFKNETDAAVNVFSLTANSTSGDIDFQEPVTASTSITGTASGGNINVSAPLVAPNIDLEADGGTLAINSSGSASSSFYGYGSTTVTGTGSVTSPSLDLETSGSATLLQTNGSTFTYNGMLTLNAVGEEPQLTLAASPLVLSGDISFEGSLNIYGGLNTQGHAIEADFLYLADVQTVTGSGGNASGINAQGFFDTTLVNVRLNGTGSGSGGTIIASGSGTEGSYLTVDDTVSANGGNSGGNGGSITLTSGDSNLNAGDGAIVEANGGNGTSGGGGGSITLTANNGSIASLSISANGGNSTGTGPGGSGGAVSLNASSIDMEGSITANGGDANASSGAAGGNGGTVAIDSDGDLTVGGNGISATSGVNGNSKFTGGAGGTVNLTAQGEVSVYAAIAVSSSDLYANRVSASGGNIKITSHATSGVAINIANSGQLASLLNQAAAGPGGKITFLADSGGSIQVSGSVRADNGTINIQNTVGSGTAVSINGGATLSADVVKVGVLSSNGTLVVGGGSTPASINGDSVIELYAAGSNGSVIFAGPTVLTGAGLKTIAGNTVTINNGVTVYVGGGAATVYTSNPNYSGNGGNGLTNGQFIGPGAGATTTKPFGSRPAF